MEGWRKRGECSSSSRVLLCILLNAACAQNTVLSSCVKQAERWRQGQGQGVQGWPVSPEIAGGGGGGGIVAGPAGLAQVAKALRATCRLDACAVDDTASWVLWHALVCSNVPVHAVRGREGWSAATTYDARKPLLRQRDDKL